MIIPNYKQTRGAIHKLADAPQGVKHLSFKSLEHTACTANVYPLNFTAQRVAARTFLGAIMPHTDDICDRPGLLGIDAALNIALASVAPISGKEMVSLGNCARRITAEDIVSSMPLPPFDQSAVDGYGIQHHDVRTRNTGPFRLAGMVVAGSHSAHVLAKGEVIRLLTGAAIPEGVGAVVMEEMATVQGTSMVIGKPAEARLNNRRRGEDVGPRTVIVEGGTLIDARRVAQRASFRSAASSPGGARSSRSRSTRLCAWPMSRGMPRSSPSPALAISSMMTH